MADAARPLTRTPRDEHEPRRLEQLTLSAVIPTRNRPDDLRKSVPAVLSQTRPPEELIVVDQSPGPESADLVREMFHGEKRTRLVYIHDTAVKGLVEAKSVGVRRAVGDVVCFLEDDVILEPAYMAQIQRGFWTRPDMWGCSGVITNLPKTARLYVAAHSAFFRGIFRDPRLQVSARALTGEDQLIRCDILSGGISCWRRQVFEQVELDTTSGLHFLEDMEFSTRVVRALGHHLYVNPRARVEHLGSAVNRDTQGTRQRRKMVEAVTFYTKRKSWSGARRGLFMVMVWWLGEALLQAVRVRSFGPVTGYVRGVADGLQAAGVIAGGGPSRE